jgi:COQ9
MAAKATQAIVKKPSEVPSLEDMFQIVFDTIAERGLGRTRLSHIAYEHNIPFADLYAAYPSIEDVLYMFLDKVDADMVANVALSMDPKKDIYFEMLMSRFDTLQEHRAGVKAWLQETAKHPLLWGRLLKRWNTSLSLMLDLAKDSPVYLIKKAGLAVVYAASLREWMQDDSKDLGKTMVSIDKSLQKADKFVESFLTKKAK